MRHLSTRSPSLDGEAMMHDGPPTFSEFLAEGEHEADEETQVGLFERMRDDARRYRRWRDWSWRPSRKSSGAFDETDPT